MAHLARDVAYAVESSNDPVPWRLQLWLNAVLTLVGRVTELASATLVAKRRALERQLASILMITSTCALTRELQGKIGRACDQLLTFLAHPGEVKPTNNAYERVLRPAVIQRKVTNGYRAMWAARGEAVVRTVVDTVRLGANTNVFATILRTVST